MVARCNHCQELSPEGLTICQKCRCVSCQRLKILCECKKTFSAENTVNNGKLLVNGGCK